MSNKNEPTSEKNRPAHTVRHQNIKATVWQNPTERGPMFNVTFTRSYRVEETWHDSSSFGFEDLMTVAKAAMDAHTWISTQKANQSGPTPASGGNSSRRTERNPARQPA